MRSTDEANPRDTNTRVCCCSLNVREYEVDDCFPSHCGCCARFDDTRCHVIWLCIRHKVKCLVEHRWFEWFIVFLIAASSIALVSIDLEGIFMNSHV